ncbi:unnamed protein product [Brassica oleracea var. botrytis]
MLHGCIHYASSISDVVFIPMTDGQFLWFLDQILRKSIPNLMRCYLKRVFIFLLLVEDNPSEKLYDDLKMACYFWLLKFDDESLIAKRRDLQHERKNRLMLIFGYNICGI